MLLTVLRQPVLRSLLLGLVLAAPAYWLLRAGMPGFYANHLAGVPGLPLSCTGALTHTISQVAWAWLGIGSIWSYLGHTRHLVRATPAGYWATCLMWLLYAGLCWLAYLLYDSWPDDIVPGREPFFG
jgi:hypothetical protein